MKRAEAVAFGGSGLDRAAHLRGEKHVLDTLMRDSRAGVLPLWRGKPLLVADPRSGRDELGWLSGNSLALVGATSRVFLGLDGDAPRFAADVSAWQPDLLPDTLDAYRDPSEQRHPALPDTYRFSELRMAVPRLAPRAAELAATARAVLNWHRTHRFCAACGAESDISLGGWQRLCPACGTHHHPRTDPVVIMLVTRGNSVLIGRSPGWPEGMYSLLAGYVEPGETIEAAVRRETLEEAGIKIGHVAYLASQPWPFPASLMIGCHAEATSEAITVDPAELEDAIWVTREEMARIHAGAHPRIAAAREGAIARFLLGNWLADTLD
ncbi:NAD(+) diphosphatase [Oceaniovalibus guishaninsula]|nr:NAD(+) diphosphatase [Oceaniovalibus guishaninsula]